MFILETLRHSSKGILYFFVLKTDGDSIGLTQRYRDMSIKRKLSCIFSKSHPQNTINT